MNRHVYVALSGALMVSTLAGCGENKKTTGAAIGGVAGAAAGALIGGSENRLLGALIGGAVGAGGGYLIGTELKNADEKDHDKAVQANENAQRSPATAEQARRTTAADLNGDGYVTLDEIVAMHKANLSDDEVIRRLERSNMFFELTDQQKKYLRDNGVSSRVVNAMDTINPEIKRQAQERARQRSPGGDQSIGRN